MIPLHCVGCTPAVKYKSTGDFKVDAITFALLLSSVVVPSGMCFRCKKKLSRYDGALSNLSMCFHNSLTSYHDLLNTRIPSAIENLMQIAIMSWLVVVYTHEHGIWL